MQLLHSFIQTLAAMMMCDIPAAAHSSSHSRLTAQRLYADAAAKSLFLPDRISL